jgi:pantoate--beta-alanine ligase
LVQLTTKENWSKIWLQAIKTDKIIGFVPTMGALHEGHLQLIRASKSSCDLTIVSIFVNPTQFNNPADFDTYPNTLEVDLEKLRQENVDVVYTPSIKEIYPESPQLRFSFGILETNLEGAFRPGHFNGVGLVVSKLLNIIRPHVAFFGQKDLQQVAIIGRLVKDLSFPVDIVTVPTMREADGLAMSSRNLRLSLLHREASLILFNSLNKAKKELIAGKAWFAVQQEIVCDFEKSQLAELEYFELIDPASFEVLADFRPSLSSSICVAAYLGEIRLIDNISINF